jgi:hypothetical protein
MQDFVPLQGVAVVDIDESEEFFELLHFRCETTCTECLFDKFTVVGKVEMACCGVVVKGKRREEKK